MDGGYGQRLPKLVHSSSLPILANSSVETGEALERHGLSSSLSGRTASEGESPPSTAFVTPESGTAESETESDSQATTNVQHQNMPRISEKRRVDLNLVTRRPLRPVVHGENTWEVKEHQVGNPSCKSLEMVISGCSHSVLREFPDPGDMFTGPSRGKEVGKNTFITTKRQPCERSEFNSIIFPTNITQLPQTADQGHKEKSSSLSGISQSSMVSGMEWDPSADVDLGDPNYQHRIYPPVSHKTFGHTLRTVLSISDKLGSTSSNGNSFGINTPPDPPSGNWRDTVSVPVEITHDPRCSTRQPRSKSELGSHQLLVVDRSVQTGPIISSNSRSGSGRKPVGLQTMDTTNNSSELTPTCSFIKHLTSTGPAVTNPELLEAIAIHRREHIGNVKRELRRVQALSQLLCGHADEHSSTSKSFTDENSSYVSNINQGAYAVHPHQPSRNGSKRMGRSNTSSFESGTPKFSSSVRGNVSGDERQKVEEIMQAFRQMLENLVPGVAANSRISSSAPGPDHDSSHRGTRNLRPTSGRTTAGAAKATCMPVKAPIGYFLSLPSGKATFNKPRAVVFSSNKENEEDVELEGDIQGSKTGFNLQEELVEKYSDFVKRANERRQILANVREVRQKRASLTRNWIASHGIEDMSVLESELPGKGPRLMTSKEMRKQTKAKYLRLPEVQEEKLKRKAEKEKSTNRILSSYFSGKLRQGVLKGEVNVDLNRSVIRR